MEYSSENIDEEILILQNKLENAKKKKMIREFMKKNIIELREFEILKIQKEKEKLKLQLTNLEIKEQQINSGLNDDILINQEIEKQEIILTSNNQISINQEIKKIPNITNIIKNQTYERFKNNKKMRPNLCDIFNTNTLLRFRVGNGHEIEFLVETGKMIYNNKDFSTLASVITEIKETDNITKSRQFNAYDFVDYWDKKQNCFINSSSIFIKEYLEMNGKLN